MVSVCKGRFYYLGSFFKGYVILGLNIKIFNIKYKKFFYFVGL